MAMAKQGIDSKEEEVRRAAIIDRMNAKKVSGRRRPHRGDVLNGIIKDAVKGCTGTLKKFSQQVTAGRCAGKQHPAVPAQPSGDATLFTPLLVAALSLRFSKPGNENLSARNLISGMDMKVTMPNALVHDGSVVFKENGKCTAMEQIDLP